MGERELADDTGLARSAYMSSESALRTELLLDEADDAEETLLTLSDLKAQGSTHHHERNASADHAVMDGEFCLWMHCKWTHSYLDFLAGRPTTAHEIETNDHVIFRTVTPRATTPGMQINLKSIQLRRSKIFIIPQF